MSPDVSPEQICLNGKLNGSQKHMPTHPSFIQVPLLHHASSCKVPSPKPSNNVRCCDPWRWAYSFMDLCMGNTQKKKHQKTSTNIKKHQKTRSRSIMKDLLIQLAASSTQPPEGGELSRGSAGATVGLCSWWMLVVEHLIPC